MFLTQQNCSLLIIGKHLNTRYHSTFASTEDSYRIWSFQFLKNGRSGAAHRNSGSEDDCSSFGGTSGT